MGYERTADGRINVGMGVTSADNYKGYADVRDIVIQLTEDGATQDGLNALEYIKAYALAHKGEDKPIFPVSQNIYVSNNGKTKALEYDDIVIDGSNVTIGGIVWNGSAWDFTNAENGGGSGGGSSGGGVLVVNSTRTGTTITCDTKASVMYAAFESGTTIIIKRNDGYEAICVGCLADEYGYQFSTYYPDEAAYNADTGDDYPVAHVE